MSARGVFAFHVSFRCQAEATSAMTVQGLVSPQVLQVVSQFEPFFLWIPTGPLTVRGIRPYAFGVVQHRKFLAYHLHGASFAVVARFSSSEKRVFRKTLERPLFGKENVRGNTFARCACLPPELARHVLTVSLCVPLCPPCGACHDWFFSGAVFVELCPT